jgi:tetratricopeptide (TPR) repeat protein
MILNELADAQYELHHYEEAKTNFSEALALYESCEEKNPGKYARAIETIKQRLSMLI